jgi:hypothetical protein
MLRETPWCRPIAAVMLLLVMSDVASSWPGLRDPGPVTLSDEMKWSDVVLIGQIVGKVGKCVDSTDPLEAASEFAKRTFRIIHIIKGKDLLGQAEQIEVVHFGEEPTGTKFLISGRMDPGLRFGVLVSLTDHSEAYVRQLLRLPEKGPERLVFFLNCLEDREALLADDAFHEFDTAPYTDIIKLGELLPHDKIVAWIKDPQTAPSRRRLSFLLLGACGRIRPRLDDVAMLEKTIAANRDEPDPSLHAAIACYLTLKGDAGLPLIEDRFLSNTQRNYSHTYSAIVAVRFHLQNEEIIPRQRLLASLRILLDRADLADLVIRDLARWEDWSAMERLVTLFKEAAEESCWVRMPVAQYLMVCPLPEAAQRLRELAEIDPKAIERASLLPPLRIGDPKSDPADGSAEACESD